METTATPAIEIIKGTVEVIPERSLYVTADPTSVWLLNVDTKGNFIEYEQWEKNRRFVAKAVYRHPLGDVFYLKNDDDPFGIRDTDTNLLADEDDEEPTIINVKHKDSELAPERPGRRHRVLEGENAWRLSQLYRLTVDELLAHNELRNPNDIQAGMEIYIPGDTKKRPDQPVSYELFLDDYGKPNPRPMHVTLLGGAKKWSFGNVRSWNDIKEGNSQLYAQNHNLMIYAIAHVPIGEDVAAYYMDRNDLGDYHLTGMVKYMLGYNWQHLADGHVVAETASQTVITEEIVEKLETALGELNTDEILNQLETEVEQEKPKVSWQHSYRPFDNGPVQYEARGQIMLFDRQGVIAKSLTLKSGDLFMVSGTFSEDGATYGRVSRVNHIGNLRPDLCFAIQMDNSNMWVEDELYNTNISLADKVAIKAPLSFDEQFTRLVGRELGKLVRIKTILTRKNKQRKQ